MSPIEPSPTPEPSPGRVVLLGRRLLLFARLGGLGLLCLAVLVCRGWVELVAVMLLGLGLVLDGYLGRGRGHSLGAPDASLQLDHTGLQAPTVDSPGYSLGDSFRGVSNRFRYGFGDVGQGLDYLPTVDGLRLTYGGGLYHDHVSHARDDRSQPGAISTPRSGSDLQPLHGPADRINGCDHNDPEHHRGPDHA